MVSFNFTIYYKFEVKIGYTDFASKIDIFLFKKGISILTNTQKEQKAKLTLSDYFQLKYIIIPIVN